jgi:uncharacterized protein with NRDE domain
MCTLIALHRCIPDAPLVVAANRDEFLERPTEGPALFEVPIRDTAGAPDPIHDPRVVAPRDLRAGGTWLGINASGLFAAVTNRRCEQPDPSRRSRGWLVFEALSQPSADRVADRFEALPKGSYNPFNFFVADARSAHLVTYDERPERIDLEAGAHVVGNVHPGESSPKLDRLRADVADLAAGGEVTLDALGEVCRFHVPGSPIESTCVHAGAYGTRSSTLLRTGKAPELWYAEGPPCRAPYRDLTPLLHDLGLVPVLEGVQT